MPRYSLSRPWKSRGFLSESHSDSSCQAVTMRLADSLPFDMLESFAKEVEGVKGDELNEKQRDKIEFWLDSGLGSCALQYQEVAEAVEEALLYRDGKDYELEAWCLMPTHLHVVMHPFIDIEAIVARWKDQTQQQILDLCDSIDFLEGPEGLGWGQHWSRSVTDEEHFHYLIKYLHRNPVEAGLCRKTEEWAWSSAWKGHQFSKAVG